MKRNILATAVAVVITTSIAAGVLAQPVPPDPGPDPDPDPATGSGSATVDGSGSAATGADATSTTTPGGGPDGVGASVGPEEVGTGAGSGAAEEPNVAEDLGVAPEIFTARLYGYIDARFEKSQAQPALNDAGQTIGERQPGEFDVPNFNVMLQGRVYGRYRYYLNLIAPGSGSPTQDATIDLRNAWVEFPVYRDFFNFRIGKTYRRFGIFNEILDAVPTFIGIEAPEMFDKDHLMLTRTTNLMLHGTVVNGETALSYALSTGNDERAGAELPFGADLRFDFADQIEVGASYYTTNGAAAPTTDVGGGVPLGGTAQWMASDEFQVYAAFAQVNTHGLTLQTEFTKAHHDAERDRDRTYALITDGEGMPTNPNGLIPQQLQRFGLGGAAPTPDDVIVPASYDVIAAYVRVGYELPAYAGWTLTPYAQFDYYKNPEIINEKDFGGDNEAGLSDDGAIYKYTLGVVARPVRFVAIKVDGSAHGAQFNGDYYNYLEVRASFSLYWELDDAD